MKTTLLNKKIRKQNTFGFMVHLQGLEPWAP